MPNDSSTGGPLVLVNDNGFLADDALEDFFQGWLAGLVIGGGLIADPSLVRAAYQADPPPIPATTVTWLAFNVVPVKMDWDPVTILTELGGVNGATTARIQEIHIDLTAYGPSAGAMVTQLIMGMGIGQNREILQNANMQYVSANEPSVTSRKLKGLWQRRIDCRVVLRRAVQFSYAVLSVIGATGQLVTDAPSSTTLTVGDFGQVPIDQGGFGE